jgi:hypothetical protein
MGDQWGAAPASSPERFVPVNEPISPDGQTSALTRLSLEPGFACERR